LAIRETFKSFRSYHTGQSHQKELHLGQFNWIPSGFGGKLKWDFDSKLLKQVFFNSQFLARIYKDISKSFKDIRKNFTSGNFTGFLAVSWQVGVGFRLKIIETSVFNSQFLARIYKDISKSFKDIRKNYIVTQRGPWIRAIYVVAWIFRRKPRKGSWSGPMNGQWKRKGKPGEGGTSSIVGTSISSVQPWRTP